MGEVWEENGPLWARYGKRMDLYGRGMGRERTTMGEVWEKEWTSIVEVLEKNGPLWAWHGKRTDLYGRGMARERISIGEVRAENGPL